MTASQLMTNEQRGVGQDHVQQLLLTLHSFHCGILHREKKHIVATNACVFQTVFFLKLSTKYKLYIRRNCTVPAAPRRYHGYWDWCEEEIVRINNPPLATAASDSVAVATSKALTGSHQPLVLSTDFDNLSSAVGVALIPTFLSQILSCTAWRFSPKLQDKSRTESLGSRLLEVVSCLHSHVSRR